MRIAVRLASMAALMCSVGLSAEEGAPDPATIELPAMTFGTDPVVSKNGYKFFIHHNASIDFAAAYIDFSECVPQTRRYSGPTMPDYDPWYEEEKPPSEQQEVVAAEPMYGPVGAAIGSVIVPKFQRGLRNNTMRLCLERRGYVRYAVDEAAYDALWNGDGADVVARLAKAATMPTPPAPQVTG